MGQSGSAVFGSGGFGRLGAVGLGAPDARDGVRSGRCGHWIGGRFGRAKCIVFAVVLLVRRGLWCGETGDTGKLWGGSCMGAHRGKCFATTPAPLAP